MAEHNVYVDEEGAIVLLCDDKEAGWPTFGNPMRCHICGSTVTLTVVSHGPDSATVYGFRPLPKPSLLAILKAQFPDATRTEVVQDPRTPAGKVVVVVGSGTATVPPQETI